MTLSDEMKRLFLLKSFVYKYDDIAFYNFSAMKSFKY